jgi:hypothetical protein
MKTMNWVFAALLLAASPAFAAEWSLVAGSKDEIVFVDRASIRQDGELKKARVLHSYSTVRTVGDEAFPHKSEILLYAVRCEDRSLGFEQWTMTAGEIGSGATIWTGHVAGPTLYQDPLNPIVAGIIDSTCNT